jgi:predicted RNA-binding Zn ribbon-like protein
MTVAEMRVIGGHVALDLVNTVVPRSPGGVDRIGTPAELLAWAVRVGIADSSTPVPSAAAERATIEIREALYGVLQTRSPDDLARLSRHWAASASRSTLVFDEASDGSRVRLSVGADPGFRIPDRLADAAADLLRTVDRAHIRECPIPDGGCGWLFLDRSRNGTRRWCTMDDCGAHAKARRLTERRRAARESSSRG